jgi:hypothetical protein
MKLKQPFVQGVILNDDSPVTADIDIRTRDSASQYGREISRLCSSLKSIHRKATTILMAMRRGIIALQAMPREQVRLPESQPRVMRDKLSG